MTNPQTCILPLLRSKHCLVKPAAKTRNVNHEREFNGATLLIKARHEHLNNCRLPIELHDRQRRTDEMAKRGRDFRSRSVGEKGMTSMVRLFSFGDGIQHVGKSKISEYEEGKRIMGRGKAAHLT